MLLSHHIAAPCSTGTRISFSCSFRILRIPNRKSPADAGLFSKEGLALNLLRYTLEYLRLGCGEGCEDLAIKLDASLCLHIDEGAVVLETEIAERSVEAHDPDLAEISLLVAAVVERVLACVYERLLRKTNLRGAAMTEALGAYQYVAAALCGHYSSFYSCHTLVITERLRARLAQELTDDALWYVKDVRTALHTLRASTLLRVEVVLTRLARNKRTVLGDADSLCV